MAQKISRKKLLKEPDEFLTYSTRFLNYLSLHKREAIGIFGLILLFVLAYNGVQFFSQRSEQQAFSQLSTIMRQHEEAPSPETAYETLKADFDNLLSKYGRTAAAKIGRMHYANLAFDARNYDQARTLYQQSLKDFEKQPFYYNLVLSSLGHTQKAQKDYAAAVQSFKTLTERAPEPLKTQALFVLSRLYHLLGDDAQYAATVERLLSEHADSLYADLVREPLDGPES